MELESFRFTVSRLERIVVVRPTNVLYSLETQSPKGHLTYIWRLSYQEIQWGDKCYGK